MFQRRSRRFRRRPNGRGRALRMNGDTQIKPRIGSFSDGQTRNFFRSTLSAEKLFEKYNTLAKEALSSGDKTLSENYFQHADHFMRIIEDKNKKQNENKVKNNNEPIANDKNLVENKEVHQDKSIETKEEKKE